jgi:hypothetical protein
VTAALAAEAGPDRLSAGHRIRLVGEILAAYVRARRASTRLELPEALAVLRGAVVPTTPSSTQLRAGLRLGHAVERTLSVLPSDSRCLVRSLILTQLLARRGIPASLVIGVAPGPDFAAHAWVECGGLALLPAGNPLYRELVRL